MQIRIASTADVDGLLPLLKHLSCLVWDGKDTPLRESIARFVGSAGPGHLFVAGPEGSPVAAAVVYELPLVGTRQCQVLIDDLVVGPAGRGQGLGKALAQHIVAWAQTRNAAHVSARVDPSEPAGQRVYEAQGFGMADQLMQKTLG